MNLISLDEYKAIKGVRGDNATDDRIECLIIQISELIKSYCERTFCDYVNTNKVETRYKIWPEIALEVDETPVIEIVSVTINGETVSATLRSQYDNIVRTDGERWSSGTPITVTYKAGYYKLDGNNRVEDVPQPIKLAAADLIEYYINRDWKDQRSFQGVSSDSVGTTSVRDDPGFPDHIRRVLDLYKGDTYPSNV